MFSIYFSGVHLSDSIGGTIGHSTCRHNFVFSALLFRVDIIMKIVYLPHDDGAFRLFTNPCCPREILNIILTDANP